MLTMAAYKIKRRGPEKTESVIKKVLATSGLYIFAQQPGL